jgi:hypothetical protein
MAINKIQSKKAFLDFKHAKEDVILKQEMLDEMEPIFNDAVTEFLESNKELSDKWNNYIETHKEVPVEDSIDDLIETCKDLIHTPEKNSKEEGKETASQPKTIVNNKEEDGNNSIYKVVYREIVKKSHPDKTSYLSEEERVVRNQIYIDATKAYLRKDICELVYCAYLLKIDFGLGEEEIYKFKEGTEKYKIQSATIDNTFVWLWYHNEDEGVRTYIMEQYVHTVIGG